MAAFEADGDAIFGGGFPHWSADYHLLVNDEIIDPQTRAKILDRAGIAEGLGTWRPMHGRFQVTTLTEVEMV